MMIHDFDMARWLLNEEPVEVYATASCLVDPAIGAMGDVDTALVTLKTAGGRLCQISNSRRAIYGYDQRIEAHGELGMLRAENRTETQLELFGEQGVVRDKPLFFFLERYAEAYRAELASFLEALAQNKAPLVGAFDGRQALVLAEAAQQSVSSGQPVRL
jgi:myo-inositol 2-dehydrogenase/D-chiro-inositol 1-dehydrogenase